MVKAKKPSMSKTLTAKTRFNAVGVLIYIYWVCLHNGKKTLSYIEIFGIIRIVV